MLAGTLHNTGAQTHAPAATTLARRRCTLLLIARDANRRFEFPFTP